MYGTRYNIRCPFCGTVYEADHGITTNIKMRGKEDLEYAPEHCPSCDSRYWHVTSFHRGNIDSRMIDLPFKDAVDKMKKRIDLEYEMYGISASHKRARITNELIELGVLYSYEKRDLYFRQSDICADDISESITTCH